MIDQTSDLDLQLARLGQGEQVSISSLILHSQLSEAESKEFASRFSRIAEVLNKHDETRLLQWLTLGVQHYSTRSVCWFLLADFYLKRKVQFKVALLLYLRAMKVSDNKPALLTALQARMAECARHTEFGPVFTESELPEWQAAGVEIPDMNELAMIDTALVPDMSFLSFDPREALFVKRADCAEACKLPRFFRWIVPNVFAACSQPRNAEDIAVFDAAPFNFDVILTLCEEQPLPAELFRGRRVQNVFMPVTDYRAPQLSQIWEFINLMRSGKKVLIHCKGGKGRTGVLAACYIAAFGFRPPCELKVVHASAEAVTRLRFMRPCSIECGEQEQIVDTFVADLWKLQSTPAVEEPPYAPPAIDGAPGWEKKNFFLLCGLQASGKSTFADFLQKRLGFRVFSQDELGSKIAFQQALGKVGKTQTKVVVDRCNHTRVQRAEMLEIACIQPKDVVCVWFDFEADLCIDRASRRVNHPTIRSGTGRSAITAVSREFETPSLTEGYSAVVRLGSLGAIEELMIRLVHGDVHIMKFPRTRHLTNLGSASRDDLIYQRTEADALLASENKIIIQEKIDGANIGISVDPDTLKFRVQNRSHYITSQSHEQFKKLDKWLDQMKSELWALLMRDVQYPGRYILFGEWMAAKHSILYTRLPDIFVAFDVYDALEGKFVSRRSLEALLKDTTISLVRNLELDGRLTVDSLVDKLMRGIKSRYSDENIEGFYIRKDAEDWLLARAKIVRPDFICGEDHWAKAAITWNSFTDDGTY